MCLGIPMKVMEKEGSTGVVGLEGVKYKTSFQLLADVKVGDYVILHAGFAIQKLDEKEAKETLNILDKAFNKPGTEAQRHRVKAKK